SNILLLIGPSGVGKTASVYECAKQVGFDVFEINAGMKRGGKEVALLLGEMCTSHLVGGSQHKTAVKPDSLSVKKKETEERTKRKGITSFFAKKKTTKQTVILIDEADILFEDDKGFWNSVVQIQEVSKRPIIITCNDSSTIPFDDLHLQETLYFKPPQTEELAAYLQ
ncbi:P-loop containing nucleoside triphosphate hydrolase protein, partial [Paraphysoderma sedebokerense]